MKLLTLCLLMMGCYQSHLPTNGPDSGSLMDAEVSDAGLYMCSYVPQNEMPCAGVPPGTVCRESGGPCDGAEVCEEGSDECPLDLPVADGEPCCLGMCSGFECTRDF